MYHLHFRQTNMCQNPKNQSMKKGRRAQSMYNSYNNNYSSNYHTSTQYNKKYPSVVGSNRYSTMPSSLNTTSYNNYNNYCNQGKIVTIFSNSKTNTKLVQ